MNLIEQLFRIFPFLILSFGGAFPNPQPAIDQLPLSSGPPGTVVLISGTNFDLAQNIIHFGLISITNPFFTDEDTISFRVPDVSPGEYAVSVENANGKSNSVPFIVTDKKAPPFTLLSPNGGEVWEIGETYEIRWEGARYAPTEKVYIFLEDKRYSYSELGAGGLQIAANLPNTGSFFFTVPPSFGYLSRGKLSGEKVYNLSISLIVGEELLIDTSDDFFTIKSSSLQLPFTLVYPNGGEQLYIGKTYTIRWSGFQYSSNEKVKISLHDNARMTREAETLVPLIIAEQTPNTGSYTFTVPSVLGTAQRKLGGEGYTMEISLADQGKAVFDVSDTYFSILPSLYHPITVLSPRGGEEWKAGSTYRLEWVTSKNIENLRFVPNVSESDERSNKSTNGVEDEEEIQELVKEIRRVVSILQAVPSLKQGRYWTDRLFFGNIAWDIPPSMPPGKYKFRISICPVLKSYIECESEIDADNDGEDESDEYFSILPPDPEVFPNTTPYIRDVSVTSEGSEINITMTGSGFTPSDNVIFKGDWPIAKADSSDGRTLILYLPKDGGSLYGLSVRNRNGISNIIK
ncbi:MAG: IPT/TIG domain-containing protein [Candidatus Wildermuthbacteria bacterium]|nr:IPT/TIG domain-containing protein [Candidatus Wildermuthbacteria bacterium]